MSQPAETEMARLIEQAKSGDNTALAELFRVYRHRLRAMVDLRMDRRLQGRVDASDVLQEAYIDLARRLPAYQHRDDLPFYVWLRLVTGERLLIVHRQHLGVAKRDVRQEIKLHGGGVPGVASQSIAAGLLGQFTSAASKAIRREMQARLHEAINQLDEVDREIIALRSFEDMTNTEAAAALGLSPNATKSRYFRALQRLRAELKEVPGFQDASGDQVP